MDSLGTDGVHIQRNMGARKWRRVENARMILAWTDCDDICDDFSDIHPRTVTAFDRLFVERENMKKWNEFIEKDEEVQREILDGRRPSETEECGWFVVGGKPTPSKKAAVEGDSRKHHPAYSGKACFERLDKKSKKILMSRSVNWALVDMLEKDLRSLFVGSSPQRGAAMKGAEDVVYVANFPSPWDRSIAHAVAGYLWLSSQSVSLPGTTQRITEIRNARPYFIPPHVHLIAFLESMLKKRIEFVPYAARVLEQPDSANSTSESDGDGFANINYHSSSDEGF